MVSAIIGLLAPIATTLLKAYLKPKIKPVMEGVKYAETAFSNHASLNDAKHKFVIKTIKNSPSVMKFIEQCGWQTTDIDTIIKFAVLMVKKSPDNVDNRDKWNEDDLKTLFDFLRVIASKWIPLFAK